MKGVPPVPAPIYPRGMPRRDPWTPAALGKLGYATDREVAELIGVTVEAVRQKRERLGIPALGARTGPKPTRGATANRRVTVRLTADEHEAIEAVRGKESLAEWGRRIWRRAAGLDE